MEKNPKVLNRLRKKLNKKKAASADHESNPDSPSSSGSSASTSAPEFPTEENGDFLKMFNDVNKMIKENPEMINKVNKCISNVFGNQDLMNNLVKEINQSINKDPNNQ